MTVPARGVVEESGKLFRHIPSEVTDLNGHLVFTLGPANAWQRWEISEVTVKPTAVGLTMSWQFEVFVGDPTSPGHSAGQMEGTNTTPETMITRKIDVGHSDDLNIVIDITNAQFQGTTFSATITGEWFQRRH